jgi:hypothetical protein
VRERERRLRDEGHDGGVSFAAYPARDITFLSVAATTHGARNRTPSLSLPLRR